MIHGICVLLAILMPRLFGYQVFLVAQASQRS
jgi:hypothetical protein